MDYFFPPLRFRICVQSLRKKYQYIRIINSELVLPKSNLENLADQIKSVLTWFIEREGEIHFSALM